MPTGVVILINTKQHFTAEALADLRSRIVRDLGLTGEDFHHDGPFKIATSHDHDIIPASDHSTWLNLNLHRAYYGHGYHRGDINLYIRCADWIEKEMPGCEIYYGHDVTDESLVLFDQREREARLSESGAGGGTE